MSIRPVLGIAGGLMIGYGVFRLLTRVHWVDLVRLARWGIFSWLINDLLIMPAAVLLGLLIIRRIPQLYRAPLRAGLLALGSLIILTGVAIGGSEHRRNPTVIPNDPITAFVIVGLVTLGLVGAAELIMFGRRRRAVRSRSDTDADPT